MNHSRLLTARDHGKCLHVCWFQRVVPPALPKDWQQLRSMCLAQLWLKQQLFSHRCCFSPVKVSCFYLKLSICIIWWLWVKASWTQSELHCLFPCRCLIKVAIKAPLSEVVSNITASSCRLGLDLLSGDRQVNIFTGFQLCAPLISHFWQAWWHLGKLGLVKLALPRSEARTYTHTHTGLTLTSIQVSIDFCQLVFILKFIR